jgi:hypothetical protein
VLYDVYTRLVIYDGCIVVHNDVCTRLGISDGCNLASLFNLVPKYPDACFVGILHVFKQGSVLTESPFKFLDEALVKIWSVLPPVFLSGLDCWYLAAVEQLTYSGKSLLLALALTHGKLGLMEGLSAARLEELFQLEEWGEVEAGHDLDAVDVGSRVAAPVLMLKPLNSSVG